MSSFWQNLPKPFSILAPMEDVTDTVFRQIIAECGRPNVFFTEFTSCEGVQSVGEAKVIHRLKYDSSEKPIVAQIWGKTPDDYFKTAILINQMGFDGIDINMGCPVKKVIKMGCCSALIKNHSLAKEIVEAVKAGAGELPVSIKTRIGFAKIETEDWIGFLLSECKPQVITVHGRTVKEESKVPCHWEEINKAVKLRNQLNSNTLIVGNGDLESLQEARQKSSDYGLDGFMVGRAIFKNPFVFNQSIGRLPNGQLYNQKTDKIVSQNDMLELLKKHIKLWNITWGVSKNFAIMKKYFKIYLIGFNGSAQLRSELMETNDAQAALDLIELKLGKS